MKRVRSQATEANDQAVRISENSDTYTQFPPDTPFLKEIVAVCERAESSRYPPVNSGFDSQLLSFQATPPHKASPSLIQTPVAVKSVPAQFSGLRWLELPPAVCTEYSKRGIDTLFEWQIDCLKQPGVLNGKNLVYVAPTSGGKTLGILYVFTNSHISVSEILMLRRVLLHKKKAILVLPYVSLVQEKCSSWQPLFGSAGITVEAFCAGTGNVGAFIEGDIDVAVCTIEKVYRL